jgi:hypothetical protein
MAKASTVPSAKTGSACRPSKAKGATTPRWQARLTTAKLDRK